MEFQQKYEVHYGKHAVTPNIHLHRHIERCIIDYGPVYGFWFERFNGMLGNYHTNQKAIEIQLMHRFLDDNLIDTLAESDSFLAEQASDLPSILMHTGSSFCGDANINFTFLNAEDLASVLLL